MYLFNLEKKKVKNKARVEASICKAYIVEEISIYLILFRTSFENEDQPCSTT